MSKLGAVSLVESRFCPRDMALQDVGTGTVVLPTLGIYRMEHGGRWPFEHRYSAGMRELDRARRLARRRR